MKGTPRLDLTGRIFGRLTVIEPVGQARTGNFIWRCSCACGGTADVVGYSLSRGHTNSCGCILTEQRTMESVRSLAGRKFGAVTAICPIHEVEAKRGGLIWLCRCDCGADVKVEGAQLKHKIGGCKSCLGVAISEGRRDDTPGAVGCRSLFHRYKASANKRGHVFEISYEQFSALTVSACHYCGEPPYAKIVPIRKYGPNAGLFTYNGIDRVENDQGYTPENTVACCKVCNNMKHTHSVEVFLRKAEAIHAHQNRLTKDPEV